ncbi:hypothetical protein PRK78_005048 [Emydomyces testavorans]|uniref:Uncharacterized protein n=1 Tax=Emydomyces testavorans TaxID=2070801 RepID=A0AAF0DIT1_9EURO|nr:hypothetical protein PRK78_005048 [Emydomyces testavorans]
MNEEVVYITEWKKNVDCYIQLTQHCREAGYATYGRRQYHWGNIIFIIDDAEQTYIGASLWFGPIKSFSRHRGGTRFCLFASYGDPEHGATDYLPAVTRPVFAPFQRVSLIPSAVPDPWGPPSNIALFYNVEEFSDVVGRFCASPERNFTFDSAAQEFIYLLTDGHPGSVSSLLLYIQNYHQQTLKELSTFVIELPGVLKSLEDRAKLFGFLESFPVGKSQPFPDFRLVARDREVVATFLRVLQDGSVEFKKDDKSLQHCIRNGWLQTDRLSDESIVCMYPSNLHARYVEHQLGEMDSKPFPFEKYQDLEMLCIAVIKRFSRLILGKTRDGHGVGPSGKQRPVESAFQDEFYRSFWSELGIGIGICSEWGARSDGSIGFFIPKAGWHIQLLREGDRIPEHCYRFQPDGQYHPRIQDGTMKDWLILDCRHSQPSTKYPNEKRLWRLVFDSDYSTVHTLDCENREKVPRFHLANHQ